MAKNLNVNMNFTADVSNVESNLNKLKVSLNQISTTPIKMGTVSEDLKQATVSARQLQVHLNNAFSAKTGNLDLSKLQTSLDQSGQSLSQLSVGLLGAGKDGQQAFLQLQNAIHTANLQIKQSTGFLSEMGTVLKNTVRWQISSSLLHGFMSNVQQAYSYVQKLDKSLNDIRIVSGASAEDMAKFAEQANKSAKALSTTTTAYTNAALIYYQQGLNDQEVKERTDITMKMSNVTGESADKVSSYMTAIWNNFADGSDNLERFADIITRLGADTASSSEEIAEGLEKFAAIGNTVGLSYEYATSALATVVAQTRQTPEVVGTAYKTLFARIQDLELGNTLDDGTTLGIYSQALEKVGINIKDTSGQLKDMDAILDEMGNKWQTLSKDQQVALAQNVAGTRQYTQLVALMDNWDFFQQNLKDAQNAEGSLQEQADIYAESWEGARKRVKASAQAIYSDLIDDKTFIKGTNAVADFLNGLDKIIDATGGLRTILLGLGAIGTKVFQTQIATGVEVTTQKMTNLGRAFENFYNKTNSFNDFKKNIKTLGKDIKDFSKQDITEQANIARQTAIAQYTKSSRHNAEDMGFLTQLKVQNDQFAMEEKISLYSKNITTSKRAELEVNKQIVASLGEQVIKAAELKKAARENYEITKETNADKYLRGYYNTETGKREFSRNFESEDQAQQAAEWFNKFTGSRGATANGKKVQVDTNDENLMKRLEKIQELNNRLYEAEQKLNQAAKERVQLRDEEKQEIANTIKEVEKFGLVEEGSADKFLRASNYNQANSKAAREMAKSRNIIGQSVSKTIYGNQEAMTKESKASYENKESIEESAKALKKYNEELSIVNDKINNLPKQIPTFSQQFTQILSGASQAAMGISMLSQTFDLLKDKDADDGDKILSSIMSIGMALPLVFSGVKNSIKSLKELKNAVEVVQEVWELKETINEGINAVTDATEFTIEKEITEEKGKQVVLEELKTELATKGVTGKGAELAIENIISGVEEGQTATISKQVILEELLNKQKTIGLALSLKTVAIIAAIVAAAAAIGVVIYKYNNRFNDALKDATAATKEAKEAADSAQQEYNSLLSTITDYKDAKSALGQLTKGTDEWKQKVMEINTQVLELMDNYSGLAQYVTTEDGVLSISDEGFNYLTETAYQRALTTQGIYASKAIRQNKAEDNVTYQELAKELDVSFADAKELTNLSNNAEKLEDKIQELGIKNDEVNTKIGEAAEKIQENSLATDALTQSLLDDANQSNEKYQEYKSQGFGSSLEILSKENEIKKREQAKSDYAIDITGYEASIKNAKVLSDEWFKSLFGITSVAGLIDASKTEKDLADAYAKKVYGDNAIVTGYAGNKFKVTGGKAGDEGVQIDYQYAQNYMVDKAGKEFTEEEMEKFGNDISKLRDKISDNVSGIEKSNENLDKLANDAFTLKHGGAVDFSDYSGETLESLIGTKTDNLKAENGTRKLVEAAQDYVNNQLLDVTKDIKQSDLIYKYYGGSRQMSAEETEKLKSDANEAWKEALSEVGDRVGESDLAVAQVLIGYEDKLGAFTNENGNPRFDADRLTDYFNNQKRAQLVVDIQTESASLAESTGLESSDIEAYAQQLQGMAKYANLSAKSLTRLAAAQLRYEKAVASCTDNLKDWIKELKNSNENALISTETYQGLQTAYGDLFNIDGTMLSNDFIRSVDNAELLQKAIKGDEKAYNKLKKAATESIEIKYGMADNDSFKDLKNDVQNEIDKLGKDFEVGVNISADKTEFYNSIQDMVSYLQSLGMSAAQIGDYMVNALGLDVELEQDEGAKVKKTIAYDLTPTITPNEGTTTQLPGGSGIGFSAPSVEWTKKEVTGEVDSTAAVGAIKVKNASKSAGGAIKKNFKGSKSLGSSGSGSKKSGGGSKKSPSKKTFKDDFNSSIERYHSIDRKISKTTDEYDKLADAKDRAYGNKRLKIMDKETANIKKQISLEEKKLKQAKKYVKKDRKTLKKAAETAGTSIEFRKNGEIANYQKALKEAEKKVKKAYETKDDDVIEKATKKYDKLVEAIKNYEDSLDTTGELQEDLNQHLLDLADIELEKITYRVDLKLDLNDRALKLIQRQLNQWERSNVSGYYDGSYLDQQINAMNNLKNAAEMSNQAIHDILSSTTIGTGDAARKLTEDEVNAFLSGTASSDFLTKVNLNNDQIQAIQKYTDTMLNAADSIRDIQDQIYEIFTKNFAQYQNDFDEQYSILTHQKNMVSSLKEIFTLANTTDVELLDKMTEAIVSATKTQGLAYKENMETAQKQIELIQGRLNENITDAERKALEANLKEWENYYRENNENMLSSVQEVLQSIQDELEKNIETIKKMYEKELSGGFGTFSTLELSYDMDDEIRDTYVPAYEKIYNLSKLTKDIQKSMDDTDSIKGKQKLLALQKRINEAMEDNVELTEYDLNRLEAEYQLELAKIALEEAQNTKKNVRMQRDNLGNWSYVYTADEDKVAEAMSKYEESIYNLRKLDDERDKELERSIVDINTKYFERLQSIMSMDDGEAKDKAMTQLRDWYDAMLNATLKYAETVSTNEKKLYESEVNYYENTTGRKLAALGKWVTTFSETSAMIKYGYTNMDQALDGYKSSVDRFTNQVVNEYTKSQTTANEIMKEFGINTEYANDVVDNLNNSLADTVNKIKELGEKLNQITAEDLAKMDKISQFDSTVDKTTGDAGNIDNSLGQLTFDKVGQAATGAYTGNWQNTNGKLMFVHQNELILNKDETKAFFNLASILERIKLPELFTPTIEQIQLVGTNKEKEKIEQVVTIKAEFPNVTEHNEIELAIDNLINSASQYANRK